MNLTEEELKESRKQALEVFEEIEAEKRGSSIPSTSLLESGGMMNDIEHESRCRIADAKCVLSKALAEYKPEGLTEMEAAVAFFEQAQYWLMESWRTDCNADSNAGIEAWRVKE